MLLGRLQIFNNWSPYLVADPANVWLGLEYFCNESDEIWKLSDERMIALATEELSQHRDHRRGARCSTPPSCAWRRPIPRTSAPTTGSPRSASYVDRYENLFLIGRNGMHRYNNQDHSMLTAMMAVDNIIAGNTDKTRLWQVNTETDYHEETERPV